MAILIYGRFTDAIGLEGLLTQITNLELKIHVCSTVEALDDFFSRLQPSIVFVDSMINMDKYILLNPRSAFILWMDTEDEHLKNAALEMGMAGFLVKGTLSPAVLKQTIQEVTDHKNQELELITHYKNIEKMVFERTAALWKEKELAKEASMAKSDFLTELSHEFRTPMHAILSFAELGLEQKTLQDPVRHYLSRIHQSGLKLTALLDRLLDLAKLESGKVDFNFQSGDLMEVVREIEKGLSPLFNDRKLDFKIIPPNISTQLVFDSDKMLQVITNLLGNAIKFTPLSGNITLFFTEETVPDGRMGVTLNLRDSGPGISMEEVDYIFNKFIRSSKNQSKVGGTGLGLAICREIIGIHKGTIRATNHPDGGALFSVWLPKNLEASPKVNQALTKRVNQDK